MTVHQSSVQFYQIVFDVVKWTSLYLALIKVMPVNCILDIMYPVAIPENYIITVGYTSYYLRVRTVYPKKYAHGFVVLCFVVVM